MQEALNIVQRRKRANIAHRNKSKLERARVISQKKLAPESNIKKRAYALARKILRKKIAGGRGAEYQTLGPTEKEAIDKQLDSRKALIKKIAARLIPRVKQSEQHRLQSFLKGAAMKNIDEAFEKKFADKKVKKKKGETGYIKILDKFSEEADYNTKAYRALVRKADKHDIDLDIVAEIYNSAFADYEEADTSLTEDQFAFARVNHELNELSKAGKEGYNHARLRYGLIDAHKYYETGTKNHSRYVAGYKLGASEVKARENKLKLKEETLDELSKDTYNSYIDTAYKARHKEFMGKNNAATMSKRKKGIESASRLANKKVDEALDHDHPIVKEYKGLKTKNIKQLRDYISQSSKVIDVSGFRSKDHAISHLLRAKHGNKRVADAFGLKEETLDENFKVGDYVYLKAKTHPTSPNGGKIKKVHDEHYTIDSGFKGPRGTSLYKVRKDNTVSEVEHKAKVKQDYEDFKKGNLKESQVAQYGKLVKSYKTAQGKPFDLYHNGDIHTLINRSEAKIVDTYKNHSTGNLHRSLLKRFLPEEQLRETRLQDRYIISGVHQDQGHSRTKIYPATSKDHAKSQFIDDHGDNYQNFKIKKLSASKLRGESVEHDKCGTTDCCGQCRSEPVNEILGPENQIGTPALTRKLKKATPGQEKAQINENKELVHHGVVLWKSNSERRNSRGGTTTDHKVFKWSKEYPIHQNLKSFSGQGAGFAHGNAHHEVIVSHPKVKEHLQNGWKISTSKVGIEKKPILDHIQKHLNHIKKQNGTLHLIEDVKSAETHGVIMPAYVDEYGNTIPAKVIKRKIGKKILSTENPHDGK